MDRHDELTGILDNNATAEPLIDEIIYLENQLNELRRLPKIRVNSNNPEQQKATPAAKLYKEYLQQYINALKLLIHLSGGDEVEEESPLREWAKAKLKQGERKC